jgi:hypothetical protein
MWSPSYERDNGVLRKEEPLIVQESRPKSLASFLQKGTVPSVTMLQFWA